MCVVAAAFGLACCDATHVAHALPFRSWYAASFARKSCCCRIVAPGPGYVWVPGYHVWNGSASQPEARAAVMRIIDQFRRYETEAPAEVKTFSDTEPNGITAETLAIKP